MDNRLGSVIAAVVIFVILFCSRFVLNACRLGAGSNLSDVSLLTQQSKPTDASLNILTDFERAVQVQGAHLVWTKNWSACLMPKVGCSSFLMHIHDALLPTAMATKFNDWSLLYNHNSFPEHGLYSARTGYPGNEKAEYPDSDNIASVNDYFTASQKAPLRVVVVRHPWRRLISGFKDKVMEVCQQNAACLRKRFNVPKSQLRQAEGRKVTLHDFVKYLASVPPNSLNDHFRPMHLLCQLGAVRYNFIAELKDKLQMTTLVKKITPDLTFTRLEIGNYARWKHAKIECNTDTVRLAEKVYGIDAKLLGYNFTSAYKMCGLGYTT